MSTELIKLGQIHDRYLSEFGKDPKISLSSDKENLITIKIDNDLIIDENINKLVYVCKSLFSNYMGYGIYTVKDTLYMLIMLK